jgi:hypothetical protein
MTTPTTPTDKRKKEPLNLYLESVPNQQINQEERERVRISIKGNFSDPNHKLKAKFYVSEKIAAEVILLISRQKYEIR